MSVDGMHLMLHLTSIWWCCCLCVVPSSRGSGFISRRDHDFVGEDPALAAEIARRIALGAGQAHVKDLPMATPASLAQTLRMCQEGILPLFECGRPSPEKARRQFNREKGKGEGHWHNYIQYPLDWNETHLYSMQLKIAEQSIYSVQIRLNDFDKIVGRHKQDERFRIAYTSKKLETWTNEMALLYEYSHRNLTRERYYVKLDWYTIKQNYKNVVVNNTHGDPRMFSTYKHIIYYQLILRRYIDIVYTLDILRKMHGDLYEKYKTETAQFEQVKKEHEAALAEMEEMKKEGAGAIPPGFKPGVMPPGYVPGAMPPGFSAGAKPPPMPGK